MWFMFNHKLIGLALLLAGALLLTGIGAYLGATLSAETAVHREKKNTSEKDYFALPRSQRVPSRAAKAAARKTASHKEHEELVVLPEACTHAKNCPRVTTGGDHNSDAMPNA